MKKIGIITILKVNNYGAELQAFALHHKLEKLGFENEVIDYLYYTNPAHIPTKGAERIMQISLKNKVKWLGHRVVNYLTKLKGKPSTKAEKVHEFHAANTRLSPTFNSFEELYGAELPYSTFIVGSDQVWNPVTHTSLYPYFLTFVRDGRKKISYASSFGVSEIDEQNKDTYKKLLNNIDILSCREQAGVEIIKSVTGRAATRVLDPTLLLTAEEWRKIAVPSQRKDPYILLYVLRLSEFMKSVLKVIHEQTGLQVVSVGRTLESFESIKIESLPGAGPAEFVGLFSNASYVVTDSYHGSIFSIQFSKPFYTVIPSRKANNSRQINLMQLLGLEDRLIKDTEIAAVKPLAKIEYQSVLEKLNAERTKSVDYLTAALAD